MEQGHEGCCKSGGHGGCCGKQRIELAEKEREFLVMLSQIPFLPVAKLVLKSSRTAHLELVALAPVYLFDKCDSLDKVKETGKIILRLAEYKIISLDYDMPLANSDYDDYKQSDVFEYFKGTVEEGKKTSNFIFDIASIEFGSMALTGVGQEVLETLLL